MSSIWRAVSDQEYLKKTGEYDKRKRQEEREEKARDEKLREIYGPDHPRSMV